jgi:hypothetical protein
MSCHLETLKTMQAARNAMIVWQSAAEETIRAAEKLQNIMADMSALQDAEIAYRESRGFDDERPIKRSVIPKISPAIEAIQIEVSKARKYKMHVEREARDAKELAILLIEKLDMHLAEKKIN